MFFQNKFWWKMILICFATVLFLSGCILKNDDKSLTKIYFTQKNVTGGSKLFLVTLNASQELIPISNFNLTSFHYFSPNGEFVAFTGDKNLHIFELGTEKFLSTIDFGFQPSYTGPHQNISWSANSEMLVFSRYSFDENDSKVNSELLVFHIDSQEWETINDNDDWKSTPIFLADSQQLAYSKIGICRNNPFECTRGEQLWELEILNLKTNKIVDTYALKPDDYSIKEGVESSQFCNLKTGQNNSDIAFSSFCITDGIRVFREAFVLNSNLGEIVQLTEFGDVDFSNNYYYSWSANNDFFILGYNHNYIFGENFDEFGFVTYRVGEYDVPTFQVPMNELILDMDWSPNGDYAIGIMGPDFISPEKSFVGQIDSQGQFIQLNDSLPILSLNGCWIENGYITQTGNQMIMLTLPDLDIIDLNLKLHEDLELLGCFEQAGE